MMTMVLGKRIQEEREKRGLTQDQLAQMLNVSRQAISKWELGTAYPDIERYAKLAGIHRIRIHGLRHSHASLLISMGENPLIIKDRLGHEDIETTLGTYGHLYPNSNFEVANKLNGAISFKEAKQNYDTSLKNQFTVDYLRNKEMKKVQ